MISPEAARTDLTSRECAKLICGLLGGLVPLLGEDDAEMLRHALHGDFETKWEYSVQLRVSLRAMGALVGALTGMTQDDPEQLSEALEWVVETDEVWKRLSA